MGRMPRGWMGRTVLAIGVSWAIAPGALHAQVPPGGLSPEVIAQIEAIEREKEARTPAERKVDSQLPSALRAAQGLAAVNGVPSLQTDIPTDTTGRVVVDITTQAAAALQGDVAARGGAVLSAIAAAPASATSSVRASISLNQVLAIAARPDVLWVQPRQESFTMRRRAPAPGTGFVTNTLPTNTGQGSRTSEGDLTHRAFQARLAYGVDGTGVKIGVLSDGVTNLAASQASGDLGPVTVLPGQAGSGDEGTAMLEIIHDLAPAAQLYFASAFSGITNFANNIRALRDAGCNIVVDDVFYFVETPSQDGQAASVISNTNGGVVIQAVNEVTASGVLYFSSAGNSGNLTDGTSGTWEGDFVDGGPTGAPLPAGSLHSF